MVKQVVYTYICQKCKASVVRKPHSQGGTTRKCLECGSRDMLREDNPLLHLGG